MQQHYKHFTVCCNVFSFNSSVRVSQEGNIPKCWDQYVAGEAGILRQTGQKRGSCELKTPQRLQQKGVLKHTGRGAKKETKVDLVGGQNLCVTRSKIKGGEVDGTERE